MPLKYKNIIRGALFLTAIMLLFAPNFVAHAQQPPTAQASCSIWGSDAILACVLDFLTIPLYIIGIVITFVLDGFVKFVTLPTGAMLIPAVHAAWQITLNFVNMFFILILIITAFGTIFDIKDYSYQDILPKIIIVALLINFSFTIGENVFGFSNQLSAFLLKPIGTDIKGVLLGGFPVINKILSDTGPNSFNGLRNSLDIHGTMLQSVTKLAFFTIFGSITLFALGAAFIFTLVRIPIIWFMLAIAPIAWISYALPSLRKSGWTTWWNSLIGWSFFMPTYLFFLWIATALLRSTSQIKFAEGKIGASWLANYFNGNEIFISVLVIILLIYGLSAAKSVGNLAGKSFDKVFGKIESGIKTSGKLAAANIPFVSKGVIGAREGAKKTIDRIKEEGLPGKVGSFLYEGKKRGTERADRFADRFGRYAGFRPEYTEQQQFLKKGNGIYDKIKEDYLNGRMTKEQLTANIDKTKASDPLGFAYRKLALESGLADPEGNTFLSSMKGLAGNPFATRELSKAAKTGNYKNMKAGTLVDFAAATDPAFQNPEYTAARKEAIKFAASKPKYAKEVDDKKFDQFAAFLESDTADRQDFLDNMAKIRPDFVAAKYLTGNEELIKDLAGNQAAISIIKDGNVGEILETIKVGDDTNPIYREYKKELSKLASQSPTGLANYDKKVWQNTVFQNVLKEKFDITTNKDQFYNNFTRALSLDTAVDGREKREELDKIAKAAGVDIENAGKKKGGKGGGADEDEEIQANASSSPNLLDLRRGRVDEWEA